MNNKLLYIAVGLAISSGIAIGERAFIERMSTYIPVSETMKNTLYKMALPSVEGRMEKAVIINRPLYRAYPALQKTLAHRAVGDMPTPIVRLAHIERSCNARCQLYLKDDGLTGPLTSTGRLFGGNKVRKLEFLLADALDQGAKSVVTFGCIGSNHVVATGALAQQLGLRCIALLQPQAITDVVKRNMLLMHAYAIEMILNPNREARALQTICSFIQNKYRYGTFPYFIPTGGSCPLGIVGFVNAAFELKEQIEAGLLPEPDYIYVATGSCGTVVGLTLGVRAAGLATKVVGVVVEPVASEDSFRQNIVKLLQSTNALLHEKDATFPLYMWDDTACTLSFAFGGTEYGVATPEGLAAVQLLQEQESIVVDTTYTSKAAAGMLQAIADGIHDGHTILFWHTFCAAVDESVIASAELMPPFQQFFEHPIEKK